MYTLPKKRAHCSSLVDTFNHDTPRACVRAQLERNERGAAGPLHTRLALSNSSLASRSSDVYAQSTV